MKLKAFSSFTEETVINFTTPSLVLLSGLNGSGKSSLAEAIAYPLGYNTYSATDLQSWNTKEPLLVKLGFDSDEGDVDLCKSIKSSLLSLNDTKIKAVSEIQEKLNEIIGLETEFLALLTYRAQNQPGLFLSLGDTDKKEFLTKLLPILTEMELELKKSTDEAKVLDTKVGLLMSQLSGTFIPQEPDRARKELLERAIVTISLEKDMHETRLKEAKQNIEEFKTFLKRDSDNNPWTLPYIEAAKSAGPPYERPSLDFTKLNELEDTLNECKSRLTSLKMVDSQALMEFEANKKAIEKDINFKKLQESKRSFYEEKIIELNEQLKLLNDQKCPTCLREWEEVVFKRDDISASIGTLNSEIGVCDRLLFEIKQLEDKLDSLEFSSNPEIQEFEEALINIQKEYNDENNRLSTLDAISLTEEAKIRAEHIAKINELKAKELQFKSDVNNQYRPLIEKKEEAVAYRTIKIADCTDTIKQTKFEIQRYNDQLELYDKQKAVYDNLSNEIKDLELKLNIELEFTRCLKEFLGAIFEQVLNNIADETNKILSSVSNVSHCSIRFDSENITAKGVVQKKIIPVINISGNERPVVISKGRPRCSGVSGGMMTAIQLAVDLALGHVISNRSGVIPKWLILDEVLDGLDNQAKESCLEILQIYAQERLVLVIEHSSEFTSMFNKVVKIKCENGSSYIDEE